MTVHPPPLTSRTAVKCGRNQCDNEADGGMYDADASDPMAYRVPLCAECSREVTAFLQKPKGGRGPGWAN